MEQKEAMKIIYDNLLIINYVEVNGSKTIYSSGDKYMVASFKGQNSNVSPIYNTLEEAQAW